MKRVFAVIVVGIFLISLVGCGALGDEKKTSSVQNTPNISVAPKSSQSVKNLQGTDEISNQFSDLDFDGSLNTNDQVTEQDLDIPNP